MTPDHAATAVEQIELMFGKEFTPKARTQLVKDLECESTQDMVAAIKELEAKHSYLPTPIALLRIVRECGASHADRLQDQRAKDFKNKPFEKTDPTGFKIFQAMNRLFFSGKATRAQILDKCREADKVKPDAGWAKCGASLQRFYEKRGLDMDKPPGGLNLNCNMDLEGGVYLTEKRRIS